MAESKVNRDNYIVVQGWMLTELRLKGNELLIFACIHGFSQEEGQAFAGSVQYLADWTNATRQSVYNALNSLEKKQYIEKVELDGDGAKKIYYVSKFLTDGVKKIDSECQKIRQPCQKIRHNKIGHNIENNIVDMQRRKNRGKKKTASVYDEYAKAGLKKQIDEWRAKNEGR